MIVFLAQVTREFPRGKVESLAVSLSFVEWWNYGKSISFLLSVAFPTFATVTFLDAYYVPSCCSGENNAY